jgi:hypothetical protein
MTNIDQVLVETESSQPNVQQGASRQERTKAVSNEDLFSLLKPTRIIHFLK